MKKKDRCHHCGKLGHFKRECRKLKRELENKPRNSGGFQNGNNRGNNSWNNNNNQNNNFNPQSLLTELRNIISENKRQDVPPPPPPAFNGFMAKLKFRANVAELSEEKTTDAYIDSGATHHFFHHRSIFENYETLSEEPVRGAAGITKIVGKGMVHIPIGKGFYVEAYHAPEFSSNILSVRLLQKDFEVLFSESLKGYPACYLMEKGSHKIRAEFPLKRGLYPVSMNCYKYQALAINIKENPIDEWHRILGHPNPARQYALSKMENDVPQFQRASLFEHQCVPCMTAKFERSKIHSSTRRTTRPLELVHLDISGKMEPSLHG